MNRIVVCLGSNIDKEHNLPAAVRLLAQYSSLLAVSGAYESEPVGARPDDPTFFNAAVLVESTLSAAAFKEQVLARVERELKRTRTEDKNAPRTIDADLVLFNDESFAMDADHPIPDPDLLRFPHVAVPVAEVVPRQLHPLTGERLDYVAARLVAEAEKTGLPNLRRRSDIALDPRGNRAH